MKCLQCGKEKNGVNICSMECYELFRIKEELKKVQDLFPEYKITSKICKNCETKSKVQRLRYW